MTTRLSRLLEEITGMNPGVLGDKNVEQAVRERMSVCKIADMGRYLEKARVSSDEAEALIEALAVPETWFFRDNGPFNFLRGYVRDEWIPSKRGAPLRVLSAPCSSGEEPYSIAMMLQEAGLQPDKYEIDALDISRVLLQKAERAVYTPHSFRGVPESLRVRYFVTAGREYTLKETVRHGVRFIRGNLLDAHILSDRRPYDIAFFRNLLIYLSSDARTRVLKNIERLTAQNGLLFVGHAETACFTAAEYTPVSHSGVFAFRRMEVGAARSAADAGTAPSPIVSSPSPVKNTPEAPKETRQLPARAPDILESGGSFEEALRLADQGRLPEAAAVCERLLLADRANAHIHCLLGIVLNGLGNLQRAEACFARAIYLDERCYDAVVHLSLIKEHQGDLAAAEVLRRRAARIQPERRTL